MGAGTDAERRPVFHPRSSNRTCPFRASGFPTGFIVRLTHARPLALGAERPPGSHTPFRRELAGAWRGHLVPPSQEMPYPVIYVFVNRPIRLAFAPAGEVLPPALQLLVQLWADLLPRCAIPAIQQFSHLLLDPVHALVRRTVSSRSASQIGSKISFAAVCATRSRMVGMPSARSPPPGLGINFRLTGPRGYPG